MTKIGPDRGKNCTDLGRKKRRMNLGRVEGEGVNMVKIYFMNN